MLKTNSEVDSPPQCFGDPKLFDRTATECVGGHDPTHYNNNANSRHFQTQTRDACDWVSHCSARVQAQLIPASSLVRPPAAPSSPWSTKFNQPPTTPVTQAYKPPTPGQPPAHAQQQYMAVNFGIPQYLSVREPTSSGFGARLARESLRSMLKSIGHTFAHFFDVEIFGGPPNGGGNPPVG